MIHCRFDRTVARGLNRTGRVHSHHARSVRTFQSHVIKEVHHLGYRSILRVDQSLRRSVCPHVITKLVYKTTEMGHRHVAKPEARVQGTLRAGEHTRDYFGTQWAVDTVCIACSGWTRRVLSINCGDRRDDGTPALCRVFAVDVSRHAVAANRRPVAAVAAVLKVQLNRCQSSALGNAVSKDQAHGGYTAQVARCTTDMCASVSPIQ